MTDLDNTNPSIVTSDHSHLTPRDVPEFPAGLQAALVNILSESAKRLANLPQYAGNEQAIKQRAGDDYLQLRNGADQVSLLRRFESDLALQHVPSDQLRLTVQSYQKHFAAFRYPPRAGAEQKRAWIEQTKRQTAQLAKAAA